MFLNEIVLRERERERGYLTWIKDFLKFRDNSI